jgi:anti-sigma regulatory factor (Ser/Thr protein kinase)
MSLATCSAIIDLRAKSCQLTSHGFPRPHYVTDKGKIRPMIDGGSPLGWFPDIDENEIQYPCQEGGAIYFWSDGLDDTAARMGVNTFSALYRFLEGPDGEKVVRENAVDDLMVVRFQIDEVTQGDLWSPIFFSENYGADHLKVDAMQEEWSNSFRFVFPQMPEERLYDILLATREAILNGMIHGAKKDLQLKVFLQICYCAALGKIRVRIDDPGSGHGFDLAEPMETLQAKLHDEHSGLTMIKFLCQNIRSERNGATVIMDFDLQVVTG